MSAEFLLEVVHPLGVAAPEGLDRRVRVAGENQTPFRAAHLGRGREEVEEPLLHERQLLAVVHEDVGELTVKCLAHVVEVRDQLDGLAQEHRVVDP